MKKALKTKIFEENCQKNRKNVEFWFALSSHLITIDMCCKGQLIDQLVAIRCRFEKT